MCEILEPGEYYKVKEPEKTWADIGGAAEVKERLVEMVVLPLKHPETFKKARTRPPRGILMWGPPKTSMGVLVEAAAKDSGCKYISVRAQDVLSDPHIITHLFEDALSLAPVIVFIRDIDILAPRREAESTLIEPAPKLAPPEVTRQLFAEVDRTAERQDVIIIGATHRPDLTDPALLRNGRLDRKIFVPEPDFEDRVEIFRAITKDMPLHGEVTPEALAEITDGYSHTDLLNLPREATLMAIKEQGDSFETVGLSHFKKAMERIPPVGREVIKRYYDVYKEECKHRYMY
ncbi:MAG: AAA family ATPase [Methanobacteriota archaeon]|nr:MAG: AAA family ATPase [Euryarchaeota archaeon]